MIFKFLCLLFAITLAISILSAVLPPNSVPKNHTSFTNNTEQDVNIRGERWHIWIGDPKWDVYLDSVDAIGITLCNSKDIEIHSDLNYFSQHETVFHELLHAGTCGSDNLPRNNYYNSEQFGEHPGLDRIATFTTTLFHDNPDLVYYLVGK